MSLQLGKIGVGTAEKEPSKVCHELVQSFFRVCRNVGNDDAVRAGLRSDVGAGVQLGRGAALRAGRENRCPSVDGAAQPRSWGA